MTHVYDHSGTGGHNPGILGESFESGPDEDSGIIGNGLRTCDSSDSPSHASMHRYK